MILSGWKQATVSRRSRAAFHEFEPNKRNRDESMTACMTALAGVFLAPFDLNDLFRFESLTPVQPSLQLILMKKRETGLMRTRISKPNRMRYFSVSL
jgi:hypothetical protein